VMCKPTLYIGLPT